MRASVILFFAAALACSMIASASPPGQGVFPYKYTVETLPNNLKVIMIPMEGSTLISYYSIVRTGSRDEYEPGHSGFAHFFEHMMFRGTKKYPGNAYDKLITGMGADANAYTTDDYTAYHLTFAPDDLEKVIELESDRFQNLEYKVPEFQTESGAVYGEYRKGKTSPFFVLFEQLQYTAFSAHTYKHTTIGFEADIKAMPTMYEYSRSFFDRYYRPENVVLVIAGAVDPKKTLEMVKKYYSEWKPGYVEPKIPVEPPQTAEKIATTKYPGKTLPLIAVAYKGEKFDPSNKAIAASMLFGDLAFGDNSDINKKLVLNEQKVQMLGADIGLNRDAGLWAIFSMVKNPADMNYVRDQIFAVVERYQNTPVDAAKLASAKKRFKYGFLMNLDTPEKVAGGLARYVALSGGIEAVDRLFATVESLTPQDLQDAAKKYFVPAARTVVTLYGEM